MVKSTVTVVNAANTNPSRASHFVPGPVVLKLRACSNRFEIVQMEHQTLLQAVAD